MTKVRCRSYHQVYTMWKDEVRWSFRASFQDEKTRIKDNNWKMAPSNKLLNEYHRLQKPN